MKNRAFLRDVWSMLKESSILARVKASSILTRCLNAFTGLKFHAKAPETQHTRADPGTGPDLMSLCSDLHLHYVSTNENFAVTLVLHMPVACTHTQKHKAVFL